VHGAVLKASVKTGAKILKGGAKVLKGGAKLVKKGVRALKNAPRFQGEIWGREKRANSVNDAVPREMRYISNNGQIIMNQMERQQWVLMYNSIYRKLWQHCRERVPMNFLNYCKQTLTSYPLLMQGIHWGDNVATICIRYKFCSRSSYIANQPHLRTAATQPKKRGFLARLLK